MAALAPKPQAETSSPTPMSKAPCDCHPIVQRVQEPLLADPAALLDQLLVHQGDLAGGAAE